MLLLNSSCYGGVTSLDRIHHFENGLLDQQRPVQSMVNHLRATTNKQEII